MTVRLIYRPSLRRNPQIQSSRGPGQQPGFAQTLRAAFEEDRVEDNEAESSLPATRWQHGALESLVVVLVRLASVAVAFAIWRIASDLGLFWHFAFDSGVLSHWQVWFALGVLLSGTALTLSRRIQLARAHSPAANQAQAA